MSRRRREFLALTPALFLTGCPITFEQGFFNDCRPAVPTGEARDLATAAWAGLRPDQVWDVHAHLFGNGRSGSGIFSDTELPGASVVSRARRAMFLNASCAGDDEERVDAGLVARLASLADAMPRGAKVMLLAFDYTYDEAGKRREDLTQSPHYDYVPIIDRPKLERRIRQAT